MARPDPFTPHWTNEGTVAMATALESYIEHHYDKWIDTENGEDGFVLEIVNNNEIRITRTFT